jgi:hypothetical protein
MTTKYDIIPPKSTGEKEWKHDNLPEPPFRLLIVSPSASGKTVLLSNLISGEQFPYAKYFGKNIFLFSSTFALGDSSMQSTTNLQDKNVFSTLDIDVLMGIVEDQQSIIMSYGKEKAPPILLVLDDVAQMLDHRAKETLKSLFFSMRHSKISLILLIQSYKSIPRAMRINATDLVFFAIANTSERTCIAEEMPCDMHHFQSILDNATSEKWSFLVVHNKNQMERRFQKRFTGSFYRIHKSHSRPRNTNGGMDDGTELEN